MNPATLITLAGPNDRTIYMCHCGRQFESMTEALLCQLTHGEEE